MMDKSLMLNGLYIGLMSGTSLDGIDCAVCEISPNGIHLKHRLFSKWPAKLRQQLQKIINGHDSLELMLKTDQACAEVYARCCQQILAENNLSHQAIKAIGSHGQTIRHSPDQQPGFSTQIGNANRIAELTNITTVADFRNRDIAAGGQGAPLAPAFHQALFGNDKKNRIIVNIGGIANVTVLTRTQVSGFDTGPGNRLLDDWAAQSLDQPYDKDGKFAASGKVNTSLLNSLLSDPYFQKNTPKSTGSDYFNLSWLQPHLSQQKHLKAEDIQATLSELTAASIGNEIIKTNMTIDEVLVCGGGVHNEDLMHRLQQQCKNIQVYSTQHYDVDPDWVEAMAFAWLAWRTMNQQSGNIPEVTGAKGFRICGGIYYA